jgi:hypothetical protein
LIVMEKNKPKKLVNCVWTENAIEYKKNKIVKILSSKIVGQTNTTNNYTEVKKSEEIRNNITGAYE